MLKHCARCGEPMSGSSAFCPPCQDDFKFSEDGRCHSWTLADREKGYKGRKPKKKRETRREKLVRMYGYTDSSEDELPEGFRSLLSLTNILDLEG